MTQEQMDQKVAPVLAKPQMHRGDAHLGARRE